jgi:branched-subunit amino acid transport protein
MQSIEQLMNHYGWWSVLLFVVLATYFWRGLGVLLAGHVSQDSEIFKWLSAVTYALVGALTFKLILMPIGILNDVPLTYRILVCIVCMYYMIRLKGTLSKGLILGSILISAYGLYLTYTK